MEGKWLQDILAEKKCRLLSAVPASGRLLSPILPVSSGLGIVKANPCLFSPIFRCSGASWRLAGWPTSPLGLMLESWSRLSMLLIRTGYVCKECFTCQ